MGRDGDPVGPVMSGHSQETIGFRTKNDSAGITAVRKAQRPAVLWATLGPADLITENFLRVFILSGTSQWRMPKDKRLMRVKLWTKLASDERINLHNVQRELG